MPQQSDLSYPLSAVVGSEDMVLSLVLASIAPALGGVLVRGEKGTAKSTAVRALARVLPPVRVVEGDRFSTDPDDEAEVSPDGPFGVDAAVTSRPVRLVELPVGAGEDRVTGSLHLERALADGVAEYEPGLLARAHRGLLYVDEVNLLHDHLVDLLLDASATGRATVERDGVSLTHPARFVLVGTMNPEEGELRPQLLDRFGLAVDVAAPRDPATRVEVVRRRLAYEADPAAFVARFAQDEHLLASRIADARDLAASVVLGDAMLLAVAQVCAAFEVDGLRADIVTARAAVAHAAWCGRTGVTREDVRVAARLALPHRRRRSPFDSPGLDDDLLDQALDDALGPDDEPEPPTPDGGTDGGGGGDGPGDSDGPATDERPGTAPEGGTSSTPDVPSARTDDVPAPQPHAPQPEPPQQPAGPTTTAAADAPFRTRLLQARGTTRGRSRSDAGRRSRAESATGRRTGARPASRGGSLHLLETLRAAIPHQAARGRGTGAGGGDRLLIERSDLREAVREGREANLVLFCVDASGSMAARSRMAAVKATILSLLLDAYQRRDTVGLVTFRGSAAELLLPPTGSVDVAAARLEQMPAGGRTPLAEGLAECARVLDRERRRAGARRPLLVVVTDGRATSGPDALTRSLEAADVLAADGVDTVVVDCEAGPMRLGLARTLAARLGAEHLPVGTVDASALDAAVRGSILRGRAA
ncbi:VWA domain-containing protein [Nocardioides bruguierae]|uniref:VWA domain-containing protein n=1 Tax=Nocardioides bruguierae TaxID=2945102 RepID=UPI00202189EB|nr:VWA domain-containing protein [Nocardioides bruguierae]MCL8026941.1 VWA domain-containing protein [Nocardioides bruguierae]